MDWGPGNFWGPSNFIKRSKNATQSCGMFYRGGYKISERGEGAGPGSCQLLKCGAFARM